MRTPAARFECHGSPAWKTQVFELTMYLSIPDVEASIGYPIIRIACDRDLAMIEQVVHSGYKVYIPRIGTPPAPTTDDSRHHVAAGNVWLLLLDGQVVGLIVLAPKPNYRLLDNVAVAPEKQGRGFGRRLMYLAEVRARQCGYQADPALHQRANGRKYRLLQQARLSRDRSSARLRIQTSVYEEDAIITQEFTNQNFENPTTDATAVWNTLRRARVN